MPQSPQGIWRVEFPNGGLVEVTGTVEDLDKLLSIVIGAPRFNWRPRPPWWRRPWWRDLLWALRWRAAGLRRGL